MSGTEVTPLEGRDLMTAVRDILVNNPDRHDQEAWIGNYYLTPDEINDQSGEPIPFDLVREYADKPVSTQPVDPNAPWPVCGSTGCAIGWGAVLSSPSGSTMTGCIITTPDGERHPLVDYVAAKMGISMVQAIYIASTIRTRERLIRIFDALIEDPTMDPELVP